MKYQKMTADHVLQIADMERACFSMPWSENSIRRELDNPLSLWIVALDGDTVIGYVGSQSVMGEADMMNLAVAPNYRRRGVGTELIRQLMCMLNQQAVFSLTLEVRESNHSAISLYQSLGFCEVGRRPNYYSAPKEDALILRKEWSR